MPKKSLNHCRVHVVLALFAASLLATATVSGQEVNLKDLFENDTQWEPTDPTAWKIKKSGKGHVYSQIKKKSRF